ncbi:hypothetical protein DSECCO2_549180 [anaerobic digester metagenome]
MKGLLILAVICIGTILLSQPVFAQESDSLYQQKCFMYLQESSNNRIDFGCGWVGIDSENLYYIKALIFGNRFDLIAQLLDSETPATRYLAAEALFYANEHSVFILDSSTISQLNSLRKDRDEISFCSGCTGHWSYSIKALLDKKSKSGMGKYTRDWIKSCYAISRKQSQ